VGGVAEDLALDLSHVPLVNEFLGPKVTLEEASPTMRLGDWYADLLYQPGGQVVLFVNERSLLPVLIPASPSSSLVVRFRAATPGRTRGVEGAGYPMNCAGGTSPVARTCAAMRSFSSSSRWCASKAGLSTNEHSSRLRFAKTLPCSSSGLRVLAT